MIWQDELKVIDDLSKRITNLSSDISRQVVQLESRRDTLNNEIARLDADYQVILSRNEEAKKDFQKSRRLDIEQFEESKRRVQQRELVLIEKEKQLQKLKAELETEIASAKSISQMKESIGRVNHVRK